MNMTGNSELTEKMRDVSPLSAKRDGLKSVAKGSLDRLLAWIENRPGSLASFHMPSFWPYKDSGDKVIAEGARCEAASEDTADAYPASSEYRTRNVPIVRDEWRNFSNAFRLWTRMHPFFRDLGMTAATEFAVMATNLLLVSLFGRLLGAVALAEYMLLRRVVAGLQQPTQLGLGVALPRYVARAVNKPAEERAVYFVAALVFLIGIATCSGGVLIAKKQFFAHWLFGNAQMAQLIPPLCLWLLGLAAHMSVYGYYRGCLAMGRANALQLCNLVLVPLLALLLLFRTHSVAFVLSVIGFSMVLCSGLFAVPIIRLLTIAKLSHFIPYARDLLRYGIGRVPGILGGAMFFTAGPMIASHYVSLAELSYLLLGLSLVTAVSYGAAPLGMVLLSKLTIMRVQNRLGEIRTHLGYLISAVLEVSAFGCLQVLVFADVLIRIWVGQRFLAGTVVVRLVLLGVPFYLFVTALRSALDAASWRPYNTGNTMAALALFLAAVGAATKLTSGKALLEATAGGLAAALILLGWLTARVVRHFYGLRVPWRTSATPMLFGVLLGAAGFAFHWVRDIRTGVVELVVFESCLGTLFLWLLMRRGSPWILFLRSTAFQRG
jgi:O-antigen/teichoic acid export membrane protein